MKADALITQLDPRSGMAPTQVAAVAACGRSSIDIAVDSVYYEQALTRLRNETANLLISPDVTAAKGRGTRVASHGVGGIA